MSSRPPKLSADEIRKAQGETELFQILLTLLASMLSIGVATVIVLYGDTILHTVPLGLFAVIETDGGEREKEGVMIRGSSKRIEGKIRTVA
ncbi:hypothetical protein P167DRAFT_579535 [Morchella conica CCBAS932]|uniref:Uncharacterized protein n=1 Tax=Morchella conica CCBAS932 TaxID=1392247 RepID=A0A3N4K9I5_9PEZI|nr:hypothetical protein P167DRAFT_579535 [Morchella conica CCBAS932]